MFSTRCPGVLLGRRVAAAARTRKDALLSFSGAPLGADPPALLRLLMTKVSQKIGFSFAEVVGGDKLPRHGWRAILSSRGGPTGEIEVCLRDIGETTKLHQEIDGEVLLVNGAHVLVQVHSDALATATFRRHGRRP